MAMRFFTCPHCGTGFATDDEVRKHGREAHRDMTPKAHDLESKVNPPAEFEERDIRDGQADENRKRGIERID